MISIGSEDLKLLMRKHNAHLFNGLPIGYTNCNIKGTVDPENAKEYIKNLNKEKDLVIVYCANATCSASHSFASKELRGFKNKFLYTGGLYEWLLLQNFYSEKKFPTIGKCKLETMKDYKHLPKKFYK